MLILYVDRFSYHLAVERQLSPNTVASYGAEAAYLLDFLDGASPAACTSDDVAAYLQKRSQGLSKRSQAHVLSALRSFADDEFMKVFTIWLFTIYDLVEWLIRVQNYKKKSIFANKKFRLCFSKHCETVVLRVSLFVIY